MKKFAVVIVLFLVVLSGVKKEDFTLLDYFSGEYIVYTSENINGNGVSLGFCYMSTNKTTESVVGESVVVENLEIGSALSTLKARVIKTEYLEDGTTIVYAYSSLIDEKVEVAGKYVNLQIATKNDRSIIGWPLILGSY